MAIDPYGLSIFDWAQCRIRQAQSGAALNCGQMLVREAVSSARREIAQEFEKSCKVVGEGTTCTTIYAVKTFIGADAAEVIFNAHKQAIFAALSHGAKKFATGHAKRFIPVAGQIDTVKDVAGTITCVTKCVEN